MSPRGALADENMMVLWRRSLYWSSSSVAVLAALVVLVIFERRASPYPFHLGRGGLFVSGARFSEQWIMCGEHCGCFSREDRQQDRQDRHMIWRSALAPGFAMRRQFPISAVQESWISRY